MELLPIVSDLILVGRRVSIGNSELSYASGGVLSTAFVLASSHKNLLPPEINLVRQPFSPQHLDMPMRIALVIPSFQTGGAERVMSILAKKLSVWHEVHLLFHMIHEPFYSIPDRVTVHYVDIILPNEPLWGRISRYLRGLIRLRRLLKTIRPNIIVSFHEYKYDQMVILANMFLGSHIVVSDRSNPLRHRRFKRLVRGLVYQMADVIVVQTDFAREYYEQHFRHKQIALLPNPVSVFSSCTASREPLILNVGRLVAEKGQAYLIRAFAKLNPDGWYLAIVGDGPLSQELKDLAAQLGIAEKVLFPGAVKDIGTYLRAASIFVLPSLHEGFPNALAEAMAAGIPSISFDCKAGPSELIQDGSNGFLIEVGDLNGLTQKIRTLIVDEGLRTAMGGEASKVALRFSESLAIEKWEDLLESLCRSDR